MITLWVFVVFLPLLAGEAGRVGCKPCPWNLPSQLGPKMSTTPGREKGKEARRGAGIGNTPAGLQEEAIQRGRGVEELHTPPDLFLLE
jgi:hypothetical protein